ncbi:hypothetical protein D6833_12575, partial [Candidatus Parcubacteria bacterium]
MSHYTNTRSSAPLLNSLTTGLTRARQVGRTTSWIWRHPAARGNRLRAVLRFFRYQAWKRVVGRPLVVGAFGRMRLKIHSGSHSASATFYVGYPDYWEMKFLEAVLRPGDG